MKEPAKGLHWVKSEKPVQEMTPQERRAFAEDLADQVIARAQANSQTSLPTANIPPMA
jgi:hypothetical protein